MTRWRIRKNLIANFGGQGSRALMALVFVPFYVRILGVEAYGLIGLYASLLIALGLFDAGMRPTLAREMARFTGGAMNADEIRTLLRSVELPLFTVALAIALLMAAAAPWLAQHWVHPEHLQRGAIAHAFAVMGFVAALQIVESAYDSCLAGLQRQVLQNAIITAMAALRGFGALAVLWAWPTVQAFFLWQAAVALLSLTLLGLAVYRSLPPAAAPVRFSLPALLSVRRYALGMFAIVLVAVLLTQMDKFLLSRLVPLGELGRYTIAAAVAGAIGFVAGPVGNAYYPRMTELVARGETADLAAIFHQATKLTALLTGTAAAMCLLFGERLLSLWLHDPALGASAAPLLALLALGGMFNSLSAVPYLLQLAHGNTGTTLRLNLVILALFLPLLVIMVQASGALGAAQSWAAMTLCSMVAIAMLTFRRYLTAEGRRWWLGDVLPMLAVVFGAAAILQLLLPRPQGPFAEAAVLLAAGGAILACGLLADRQFRGIAFRSLRLARASTR